MKLTHPACPKCGYKFDSEAGYDLKTLDGLETDECTCPKCGCVFLIQEVVERFYIVEAKQ